MQTTTPVLLERDRELAALARATDAACRGQGGTLVYEGPAGIGKTALVQRARADCGHAGMRVLAARGGELERDFGFGVVGQLFDRAMRETVHGQPLRGPARHAAAILGIDQPVPGGPEPAGDRTLPVVLGLYWLTVNMSEEEPLALLIDDAHWCDSASIRFVSYLAHRIEELPVLLVLAVRAGDGAERLARAVPTASILNVGPLSAGATTALVRSVAGAADEQVCRACHTASGGNAFFTLELAQALRDGGLETGEEAAQHVLDWSPDRVTRAVSRRLRALSGRAQALANASAVLGQGSRLRQAAALAGLEGAAAADAADELAEAGILTPGRGLEFVHPIVRTAVYERLPSSVRSRDHGRAARLLSEERGSIERVALHAVHAEPADDPAVCTWLVEGARAACERGAPEAAVTFLERALEEPPPPEIEHSLLVELATARALTFDVQSAAALVQRAFEAATTREQRLHAALLAASLAGHHEGARAAIELLQRARAEYGDQPGVTETIDAYIANTARFEIGARRLARPISGRLRELAGSQLPADAAVLSAVGAELVMAGQSCELVASVALRGLDLVRTDEQLMGTVVYLILVRTLIVSDRFEEAGAALDAWLEVSRKRGSALDFAFASLFRADAMYRRGDVFEAEADSRSVYAFALENAWPMGVPVIAYHMVESLIELGQLDEAESVLARLGLTSPASELPGLYTYNLLLFARGRLGTARGRPELALEDLFECGRREERWDEHNPSLIPWRSEAALACNAVGRRREAHALAAEEVRLARRFGAPRAVGMALRAAALVSAHDGIDLAREATGVLERSAARLEYARALADLGEMVWLSGGFAARAESREILRAGLELANACGASALENRVLAALRAAGARPRRPRLSGPKALTPSERRVARMAASGLSNRQIAESLFVTVRTVEFHLRASYRKLGIENRRELGAALASDAARRAGQPPGRRAAPPGRPATHAHRVTGRFGVSFRRVPLGSEADRESVRLRGPDSVPRTPPGRPTFPTPQEFVPTFPTPQDDPSGRPLGTTPRDDPSG